MTNPQKRTVQPPPVPSKQNNPAVDELVALRKEMSEFRKDFANFNKSLTLRIAIGIVGSIALMWLISMFFGLLLGATLMR